jgi:SRSO17 transposase
MTPDQMIALGTAFAAYLRIFEVCVAYQPTAEHMHSYCRGLLSDLARKSIEPIAKEPRRNNFPISGQYGMIGGSK